MRLTGVQAMQGDGEGQSMLHTENFSKLTFVQREALWNRVGFSAIAA